MAARFAPLSFYFVVAGEEDRCRAAPLAVLRTHRALGKGSEKPATPEEISKRDISAAPDGTGLAVGHGSLSQGCPSQPYRLGHCTLRHFANNLDQTSFTSRRSSLTSLSRKIVYKLS